MFKPEQEITPPEQKLYSRRSIVLRGLIGIPFLFLGWRLFDLQILERKYYANLSKGNRIRLFSLQALRGLIYDKNSVVLAKNVPSYDLTLTPKDTPNLQKTLEKISEILEIKPEVLRKKIDNEQVSQFIPIVVYSSLNWRQLSVFKAYQEEFPGIGIEYRSVREFLYPEQNAHILGYLGKINKEQIQSYSKDRKYSAKILGQKGLEKKFNDYLIGYDGGEQSEVDNLGRVIKVMDLIHPIPGNSLQLTMNNRVQSFVHQQLSSKKGAVVMSNPNTGAILSMVSSPSFDPNLFSKGIDYNEWRSLIENPDKILNNRAVKGLYSPGSTFKILIAIAALNNGLTDEKRTIDCPGYYRMAGRTFFCWKKSGHGKLNIIEAIENSCNVFFYKLARELGPEKIYEYGKMFGFGDVSGLELEDEVPGILPNPEWKKRERKVSWQPGDTMNYGIGQGFLTVTPIQLVNYLNRIISHGKITIPYLVEKVEPANTAGLYRVKFPPKKEYRHKMSSSKLSPDSEIYDIVMAGMKSVIQGKSGTARLANSQLVSIAGKTGTTQVIGRNTKQKLLSEQSELPEKFRDHAWFMGYAPAENPKVSIAVFLEHGEKGSNSARLGRAIIDFYSSEIEDISSPA